MRTIAYIILVTIIITSCSNDKNAKLIELKKQYDEIAQEIKTLEEEIAKSGAETSVNAMDVKNVSVTSVQPTTFKHFVEVQGKLDGDDNLSISAKTSGEVEAVYVKVGNKVTKGQLLARLDDKILQQNLKDLQTNYEFVKDLYDKQKRLWDQKIGSEVQFLSAKNNKESLEQKIAAFKEQIDMSKIKSPINGNIEDVSLKVGQIVMPGYPVIRVVNFTKIKVVAEVAEAYVSKIGVGDEVVVYFPDIKKEVKATIRSCSKYINPINRTFSVEADINESLADLKANMVATLKINDYSQDNAIVVPMNVVQTDMDGSFLVIAENTGKYPIAKKVKVSVGTVYNGIAEITNGLKSGDNVITVGYQDLENGDILKY